MFLPLLVILLLGTVVLAQARWSGDVSAAAPTSISISPDSGPADSSVTVNGFSFPSLTIEVTFGGKQWFDVTLPSGQSDFSLQEAVPGVATGAYLVEAVINGVPFANTTFTITPAASGPFSFAVSVSPNTLDVGGGQTFTATVSVALTGGSPKTVSLAADAATGASAPSLSVTSGEPPFNSTLTGTASGLPGLYYYPIIGTSGSLISSVDLTVKVSLQTALSVACQPSSLPVNTPTTCTAQASNVDAATGSPAPTGVVSFSTGSKGTFSATSCNLVVSGITSACSVTYTPGPGSEGGDKISATYGGDSEHVESSGGTAVTAIARTTSTGLTCSPSGTLAEGSETSCDAVVTDTSSGVVITPTGTVQFSTNSTGGFLPSSSCVLLSNASCSVTYKTGSSGSGTSQLTATYEGDTDHGKSSGTLEISTALAGTATSLTCTPDNVLVGSNVSCTAEVINTKEDFSIPPTGQVTFSYGGSIVGSCTLAALIANDPDCSTSIAFGPGSIGNDSVTASYAGDHEHAGSTSPSQTVTVQARPVTTSLTCSPDPSYIDEQVSCQATVSDAGPAATGLVPSGNVAFFLDGSSSPFATCGLVSGSCSVTYVPGPGSGGTHSISVEFSGTDGIHASSNFSVSFVSELRPTQTSISCGTPEAVVGGNVTCTVAVIDTGPAASASAPDGSVSFTLIDNASIGVCDLVSGTCSLTFSPLAAEVGNDSVVATYLPSGSGGFINSASSSTPAALKVYPVFTFSVTVGTITITPGSTTTVPVEVAAGPGIPQNVTLQIAGLPPGVSAVFSPASGVPPFTSTLLLTASSSASAGQYGSIRVTGETPSASSNATLTLTVNRVTAVAFSFSSEVALAAGTLSGIGVGAAQVLPKLRAKASGGPSSRLVLRVNSEPVGGVQFSLDGKTSVKTYVVERPFVTPFVGDVPAGKHTVAIPYAVMIEGVPYYFVSWDDGSTQLTREFEMIGVPTVINAEAAAQAGLGYAREAKNIKAAKEKKVMLQSISIIYSADSSKSPYAQPQAKAQPQAEAQPEPQVETRPETTAQPEPQEQTPAQPDNETQPQPEEQTQPEPAGQTQGEDGGQAKSDLQGQGQAETQDLPPPASTEPTQSGPAPADGGTSTDQPPDQSV